MVLMPGASVRYCRLLRVYVCRSHEISPFSCYDSGGHGDKRLVRDALNLKLASCLVLRSCRYDEPTIDHTEGCDQTDTTKALPALLYTEDDETNVFQSTTATPSPVSSKLTSGGGKKNCSIPFLFFIFCCELLSQFFVRRKSPFDSSRLFC